MNLVITEAELGQREVMNPVARKLGANVELVGLAITARRRKIFAKQKRNIARMVQPVKMA